MAEVMGQKTCQAKIANFRLKLIIEQYVVCFYITVYDAHMELLVQVSKATSRPDYYIYSLLPVEAALLLTYLYMRS
jgi:hypothetical protein